VLTKKERWMEELSNLSNRRGVVEGRGGERKEVGGENVRANRKG